MTILILPTQLCNLNPGCLYCFEDENMRHSCDPLKLNMDAIRASLDKICSGPYGGSGIGLHGGEALVVGPTIIEELLELMMEYRDPNDKLSITTNGTLIDSEFIRLFKKYPIHVGVSVDGPPELNTLRGPNPYDEELTAKYNEDLWNTLKRMRREGISTGVMTVLHTENVGTPEKVNKMIEWIRDLRDIGITGGRLNAMGGCGHMVKYELTNKQLAYAWKTMFDATLERDYCWNPFREMIDNLMGFHVGSCTFGQCNYLATTTISILPDGTISNCDRTFADDLHVRADKNEICGRYRAMWAGDCAGCKYWSICGGGCPGNGIGGDWRRKTRFCDAIYETYEYIAKRIKGLMPNCYLCTENNNKDPFRVMNYNFTNKPSTYGSCRPKGKGC